MPLASEDRAAIARQISGWLPTPSNAFAAAAPLSLAESYPVFTLGRAAEPDAGLMARLHDTGQHLHLLRTPLGPGGYARSLERTGGDHELHALSMQSPVPEAIDRAVEVLKCEGFSEDAVVRVVSIRSLGVLAVWVAELGRDGVVAALVPATPALVPLGQILSLRAFGEVIERLLDALGRAERPLG